MPTYAYSCTACAHAMEVRQSFTDDALTTCPECGGRLRKRFDNVGVVFKGSGFYRTDSRAADGANGSGDGAAAKGSGDSNGSGGSKGSDEPKGSRGSTGSGESKGAGESKGPSAKPAAAPAPSAG